MQTLYFEQALVPARSIALTELVETFLMYHRNLDKRDANTTKQAFRLLLEMFPDNKPSKPDTSNFKVGYFIKFQQRLIELGYAQTQVKRLFNSVKRVFAWGGEPRFDLETYDKIPSIVSSQFISDMNTVKYVEGGKENPPRTEVPNEHVTAIFQFVPQVIADILKIQLLTGMRPSEVCKMRGCDIKRTKKEFAEYSKLFDDENWIYTPPCHKTKKHIGNKVVPLGLQEQEILTRYLVAETEMPVFAKTSKRGQGKPFTAEELSRYVKRAIDKHGLEKFVPYQIRHTNITETSLEHGWDIARAVAGHTTEAMTSRYDHSDLEKSLSVVKERNRLYREQKVVVIPTLRIFNG